MTIDQIRTFVAVAHHGSMRSAARALGKSQPAITASIRRLEISLDGELFAQGSRPVKLSRFGERFLKRATELVNILELTDAFSSRSCVKKLSVCFDYGLSFYEVVDISLLLLRENPLRSLDLFRVDTHAIQKLLIQQKIDIAITQPFTHLPSHLQYKSVGWREFVEVQAPEQSGRAHRQMFVHGSQGRPLWCSESDSSLNAISFNRPQDMLSAMCEFYGIGWLPKGEVEEALAGHELVLTERVSTKLSYQLIWQSDANTELKLVEKMQQVSQSFALNT
ncbi:LysR family transcriptional regulator [Vibrio sp. ZSDZ65]|uniref:LysR family transcriptional regulator n=1 Tax=Vibrio qingdaonensis TaxID=2829491 RepID=A0A9X3CNB7_9VIBR|nr:LysR family transcriptional regulator [Vibrio qingdaonensis]MCW8346572.1 LysR family transcriptional regulator [Vibrio qingdaonensis]